MMHAWFFSNVNVNALTPKPKYPREVQPRKPCECYVCGGEISPLMYVRQDGPKLRAHRNCKPHSN